MDSEIIIISIITAIVGVIISWLIAKAKFTGQAIALQEQLKQKEALLISLQSINMQLQLEKEQLLSKLAISETQLTSTQQQLKETKTSGEKLSEQMKVEMEGLAERVMKSNSLQMAERNEEKIGEILKPLKTELGDFKKKVEENLRKGIKRAV